MRRECLIDIGIYRTLRIERRYVMKGQSRDHCVALRQLFGERFVPQAHPVREFTQPVLRNRKHIGVNVPNLHPYIRQLRQDSIREGTSAAAKLDDFSIDWDDLVKPPINIRENLL